MSDEIRHINPEADTLLRGITMFREGVQAVFDAFDAFPARFDDPAMRYRAAEMSTAAAAEFSAKIQALGREWKVRKDRREVREAGEL